MERFVFIFNNKPYNAVRFDGECIDLCEVVLAEDALNDAVIDVLNVAKSGTEMFDEAYSVDGEIFGYGSLDLILNGTEEDLEKYVRMLL